MVSASSRLATLTAIADDGEVHRVAVADATQQQRAGIDADADGERASELGLELRIDAIERQVDVARRAQRLPAAGIDAVALAEHGQQPVAEELVDPAAVRGDGGADDAEELVEHVDDVERQPLLRQAREIAQVDEHDDERLLDAGRIGLFDRAPFRARCCRTSAVA